MSKKYHIFYGWVVAISCSLLAFSINAMGNNSLSFYVAPLSESLQISRAALNFFLFTVGAIVRTVLGFFYGIIVKRIGTKTLMWIGCLLAVGAYLVFSCAKNALFIALGSGLYGLAHALGTFSAYNAIINHWFIRRKGIVLGLVNTSVGLGGMLINPLASYWISSAGWNSSFLYTALLIAAIALPALCLIKVYPSEKGLLPYGYTNIEHEQIKKSLPVQEKLQFTQVLHTLRFWLIAILQFLIGFGVSQAFSSIIPHLNNLNVNETLLSGTLSILFALGTTLGNFASGIVFDHFGLRALFASISSLQFTGIILACFLSASSSPVLLSICVICIGYGNSLSLGTLNHLIHCVYQGEAIHFPAIFSCLFAISNAGSILGSPFSGWLFDLSGSYRSSFILAGICLLIVLLLANLVISLGRRCFLQASKSVKP